MAGRRGAMGLVGAIAFTLVLVGGLVWLTIPEKPPAFSCSPALPPGPCGATERTILSTPRDQVFWPALSGNLTAVDVQPAPSRWASSPYAGYRVADWAARLEIKDHGSFLAACYYSSDDQVFCHTDEAGGSS